MNLNEASGGNLIGLASSIAILISKNFSSEDLGVLAAFFSALGDNLAIFAALPTNNSEDEI
jgi:hypothetical protein